MKLIFALGNPEPRYDATRHNVGFWAIDRYTSSHQATFTHKPKFQAVCTELHFDDQTVVLAKPTTYYNLAGDSYQLLTRFYNIEPSDALIIHDDLALPFGTIRTRIGGSDGGSNGLKSIISQGGKASCRLRIGIATEQRRHIYDRNFVLSRFSTDEHASLAMAWPHLTSLIDRFIAGNFEATTYHWS
jgi:PTH1 family peptidyl-tRNA hydrolase